jgi:hypothetical protein
MDSKIHQCISRCVNISQCISMVFICILVYFDNISMYFNGVYKYFKAFVLMVY